MFEFTLIIVINKLYLIIRVCIPELSIIKGLALRNFYKLKIYLMLKTRIKNVHTHAVRGEEAELLEREGLYHFDSAIVYPLESVLWPVIHGMTH